MKMCFLASIFFMTWQSKLEYIPTSTSVFIKFLTWRSEASPTVVCEVFYQHMSDNAHAFQKHGGVQTWLQLVDQMYVLELRRC